MSSSIDDELSVEDWRIIDLFCDRFETEMRHSRDIDLEALVQTAPQNVHSQLRHELERITHDVPLDFQQAASRTELRGNSSSGFTMLGGGATLGRFVLKEKLGSGSSSIVWKAKDTGLDRWVALKVPQPLFVDSGRFLREAQLSAKLNHPNIASILEVHREQDRLFLVTELVIGGDLESRLKASRFDFEAAAKLVSRLADAIDHCHSRGVIHRDLKPQNILTDESGDPRIIDFGLATQSMDKCSSITRHGQIIGTPAYMSPEQFDPHHAEVDHRSDIYSIGVILYRMLTESLPHQGEIDSVKHQVLSAAIIRPRQLNPRVPRDLETICLKCLEKNPADRFDSGAGLRDELDRYARGLPIRSRRLSTVALASRWAKRNKRFAALAFSTAASLICLVVGSTLAAISLDQSRQRERELRIAAVIARELAHEQAEASHESFEFIRRMFESSDAVTRTFTGTDGAPPAKTVEDILEIATDRIDSGHVTHPAVRSALMDFLGNAWRGMGDLDTASRMLEGATFHRKADMHSEGSEWDERQRARNLFYRAWVQHDRGQYDEAETLYKEAAVTLSECTGVQNRRSLDLLAADIDFQLAHLLGTLARNDEAARLFQSSLLRRRQHLPPDSPCVASARIGLAISRTDGSFESIVSLMPLITGNDRVAKIAIEYLRVLSDRAAGNHDSACETYSNVIDDIAQLVGDEHPLYLLALGDYAEVAKECGDYEEALRAATEAIEKGQRLAPRHPHLRNAMTDVGEEMLCAQRFQESIDYLNRALEIPPKRKQIVAWDIRFALTWSYIGIGDYENALHSSQILYDHRSQLAQRGAAWACFTHATVLHGLTQHESAVEIQQRALELAESEPGDHAIWSARQGRILLHHGRAEQARRCFQRSVQLGEQRWNKNHPRVASSLCDLAEALESLDRRDEALSELQRALDIYMKTLPADDHRIAVTSARVENLGKVIALIAH